MLNTAFGLGIGPTPTIRPVRATAASTLVQLGPREMLPQCNPLSHPKTDVASLGFEIGVDRSVQRSGSNFSGFAKIDARR